MWKRGLIVLLVLVALAAAGFVIRMGPRNIIGMIRYDQREEGALRVGDRAPEVALVALDGSTPVFLSSKVGGRPSVVVFGSFT